MVEGFENWEIAVAKNVVSSFLKSNKIREYTLDDLLQECLLHWYQKRGKYRSDRKATRQTFMGHILRRRLQEILREHLADKRKVNQVAGPIVVRSEESDSDEDTYDLSNKKQEEKFLHISLEDGELISAKLRFKIEHDGKSQKPLSVELRPPERTSLNKKRDNTIIEEYLRENEVLLV